MTKTHTRTVQLAKAGMVAAYISKFAFFIISTYTNTLVVRNHPTVIKN